MGANLKSATLAGEWWRLATSMFVHVGLAHLLVNVYGLWVLGKLAEQMFGSARYVSIYVLSGLVGSLASLIFSEGVTSAGASGAVLGILGAIVSELLIHRKRYAAWGRVVLGNLLFLICANIAIGFLYPVIDQSAHVGGMGAGLILGGVASYSLRLKEKIIAKWGIQCLGLASILVIVASAVLLITQGYETTLQRYGVATRENDGLTLDVPRHWEKTSDGQWIDRGASVVFELSRYDTKIDIDLEIANVLRMKKIVPKTFSFCQSLHC